MRFSMTRPISLLILTCLLTSGSNVSTRATTQDTTPQATPHQTVQYAPAPQGIATCQVPQLYKNPLYDSPTRANPGDPFLIPGSYFAQNAAVVYQLTPDPTRTPITPTSFPFGQTRTTGTIAPTHIDDNGLQIILPPVMQPGEIYTLWVV